jgi:hypothetical protein
MWWARLNFFFLCNKEYQVEEKYLTILKHFNLTFYPSLKLNHIKANLT